MGNEHLDSQINDLKRKKTDLEKDKETRSKNIATCETATQSIMQEYMDRQGELEKSRSEL
jgi:chaperonin cofactor prefoldin